jgi:murein DD-endopeptidase MepM/ murein hydrolase activator NlpD
MEKYSINLYRIPVRRKVLIRVVTKQNMLPDKEKSHLNKLSSAIDFVVPEGSEVFAAFDGKVVDVKDDSDIGGWDKKYWDDGNYVAIKHANGEYTWYEHLRFKGAVVKVGDNVKKGQLIGFVGKTGYTMGPYGVHLHFEVFILPSPDAQFDDGEDIKASFEDFPNIYEIGE